MAPTSDLVARVRDPAFERAAGPAPAPRPDADAAGPESDPARLVLFRVPVAAESARVAAVPATGPPARAAFLAGAAFPAPPAGGVFAAADEPAFRAGALAAAFFAGAAFLAAFAGAAFFAAGRWAGAAFFSAASLVAVFFAAARWVGAAFFAVADSAVAAWSAGARFAAALFAAAFADALFAAAFVGAALVALFAAAPALAAFLLAVVFFAVAFVAAASVADDAAVSAAFFVAAFRPLASGAGPAFAAAFFAGVALAGLAFLAAPALAAFRPDPACAATTVLRPDLVRSADPEAGSIRAVATALPVAPVEAAASGADADSRAGRDRAGAVAAARRAVVPSAPARLAARDGTVDRFDVVAVFCTGLAPGVAGPVSVRRGRRSGCGPAARVPGAPAEAGAFRTMLARSAITFPHVQNGRAAGRRALRRLARIRNVKTSDNMPHRFNQFRP
ncbi:hypothetical protein [Asanoa ishikariensis]|uniref:hypothetical protein n=1 Tax=Asanoa ishikariensis TaxID=137265 RepID=UPI000AE8A9A1|nr:hypothetical protein [Asanoa ishikariensis]